MSPFESYAEPVPANLPPDFVRGALAGKNLLITGVTGFLGKVLVAFLLDEKHASGVGRLTLLSRGKRGKDGRERIEQLFSRSPALRSLRARHGDDLGAFLRDRIDVVSGDAREPWLGIGKGELETLSTRIDAVVHVAGLTDFGPDPLDALQVNVNGALGAAEVAGKMRGKRLLHVSTCFVAGGIDGSAPERLALDPYDPLAAMSPNGTRFRPEDELLAMDSLCRSLTQRYPDQGDARRARIEAGTLRARSLGWPNLYTYSKALAELLLAARQARGTALHLSLVRPAIVECARSFPLAGWNEGVNTAAPLVWLTGTMHRRMPFTPEHVMDVVPVDDAVKGLTLALAGLLRKDTGGASTEVMQLATGDHNPLTFGRALDLTSLARRRQYARSSDPVERVVLQHLDSVIHEVAPEVDPMLPAFKTAARAARDVLVQFDPDLHLPDALRGGLGKRLYSLAQKAGKELGQASRVVGQVVDMLKAYQPFVFDHDPRFVTERARGITRALGDEERALFGFETDSIEWRDYWMNVEIPGLDRWSLPLLRGERAPEDEPIALGASLPIVPSANVTEAEERMAYAGDAE